MACWRSTYGLKTDLDALTAPDQAALTVADAIGIKPGPLHRPHARRSELDDLPAAPISGGQAELDARKRCEACGGRRLAAQLLKSSQQREGR
jgi:hypothetical protein